MKQMTSSEPIDIEISNCYQIMKLFKVFDIDKIRTMYESTYAILVEEVMKDPEFNPKKAGIPTEKRQFLGK